MSEITFYMYTAGDFSGDPFLTAHAGRLSSSEKDTILENLEGWEERSMTLETVPALFENGSYVTRKRVQEFDFTVTLFLKRNNPHTLLNTLKGQMLATSPMSFVLQKRAAGVVVSEIGYSGYPVSVDTFEMINHENVRVSFTVRVINNVESYNVI